MIGTRFYKNNLDDKEYSKCAEWCNKNDAYIEDMGDFFECIKIPVPSFDELKEQKKFAIASARYEEETGGIDFEDVRIDTGRDSQSLITAAVIASIIDSSYCLNWKTESGFIRLNAEQLIAMAQAVRQHVQSCFDKEALLIERINNATTVAEVEAVKWNS